MKSIKNQMSSRKYTTQALIRHFQSKLLHLRELYLLLQFGPEKQSSLKLIKFIHEYDLITVYLNVEIVLRILICTPTTNSSTERSFSCLKKKKYPRLTMSQQRLNAFAILCFKNEFTK